jgi:hypothetical protein
LDIGCRTDEADILACRRAASSTTSSLTLKTDLPTNQGRIPATFVGYSGARLGTDGSIDRVTLVTRDDSLACSLYIRAVAQGAAPNTLVIASAGVRGFPCGLASTADFSSEAPESIVGTLSLSPRVHCEGELKELCVTGTMTIEIAGHIPAQFGSASLSFMSPIVIEGTLCGDTN